MIFMPRTPVEIVSIHSAGADRRREAAAEAVRLLRGGAVTVEVYSTGEDYRGQVVEAFMRHHGSSLSPAKGR